MIQKNKERIAYPARKLDGQISSFHKYQFKIKEALDLIDDERAKMAWLDYHGLNDHILKYGFFFDVPSGLKAIIKVSKSGVPRMYYQQVVYKKSVTIDKAYKGEDICNHQSR